MKGTSAALRENDHSSDTIPAGPFSDASRPLRVLIVSADPILQAAMSEILEECGLKGIPAIGLQELRSIPLRETVVACLCGFSLADGTIREVSNYLKNQSNVIPIIMVSAPAPIREYGDFLESLSVGAFDFICHPYRVDDIQLILWSAIQSFCEESKLRIPQMNKLNGSAELHDFRRFSLRQSA
jgi:DNA-binding NtrC family response regulator